MRGSGGNAKACVYLGIALFELGKIQEGIAALKKGLQVSAVLPPLVAPAQCHH